MSTLGLSPLASRITSHTASLMRSAAKLMLFRGERQAEASTRSVCFGVIQSLQRTRRPSAYKSCSLA